MYLSHYYKNGILWRWINDGFTKSSKKCGDNVVNNYNIFKDGFQSPSSNELK